MRGDQPPPYGGREDTQWGVGGRSGSGWPSLLPFCRSWDFTSRISPSHFSSYTRGISLRPKGSLTFILLSFTKGSLYVDSYLLYFYGVDLGQLLSHIDYPWLLLGGYLQLECTGYSWWFFGTGIFASPRSHTISLPFGGCLLNASRYLRDLLG